MIDWADALYTLGVDDLDTQIVDSTLGCILKYKGDIEKIQAQDKRQVLDRIRQS
jgi:hypothetical protein